MGWKEYDDSDSLGGGSSKRSSSKGRKGYGRQMFRDEAENEHKKKRSSIRSHRKKTHKDEFWEDNQ